MKIFPTIASALCLGGSKLAVDGVLLIGEHGETISSLVYSPSFFPLPISTLIADRHFMHM